MRDKPWYPVVYMFVITVLLSALLIGFSRYTRDKIEVNVQMAFERAVVGAFIDVKPVANQQVHQMFTQQFKLDEKSKSYIYSKDGQVQGYAVPFAGQGFWDNIRGILGIAADKRTVSGITFYEQTETPGLGARIDENDFKKQFPGVKIKPTAKPIGIRPAAQQLSDNEVHAVTGATQTSVRLEKLINDSLVRWLESQGVKEPSS
ncbi:MAG: FMN-binding protein [Planctomycetaceae bacterium]|nr:FMN-binding protein [Planctomycetaceae bacterium]